MSTSLIVTTIIFLLFSLSIAQVPGGTVTYTNNVRDRFFTPYEYQTRNSFSSPILKPEYPIRPPIPPPIPPTYPNNYPPQYPPFYNNKPYFPQKPIIPPTEFNIPPIPLSKPQIIIHNDIPPIRPTIYPTTNDRISSPQQNEPMYHSEVIIHSLPNTNNNIDRNPSISDNNKPDIKIAPPLPPLPPHKPSITNPQIPIKSDTLSGDQTGPKPEPHINSAQAISSDNTHSVDIKQMVNNHKTDKLYHHSIDLTLTQQSQILLAILFAFFFGCTLMRCCCVRKKRNSQNLQVEYMSGHNNAASMDGDMDWSDHTEDEQDDQEILFNGGKSKKYMEQIPDHSYDDNQYKLEINECKPDPLQNNHNIKILMDAEPVHNDDEYVDEEDEREIAAQQTDEETRAIMREFKDSDDEYLD